MTDPLFVLNPLFFTSPLFVYLKRIERRKTLLPTHMPIVLSIISSIIFQTTEIKEREKLKSEHSIKLGISNWKNRGKFMCEHAHKNTNNWKKEGN